MNTEDYETYSNYRSQSAIKKDRVNPVSFYETLNSRLEKIIREALAKLDHKKNILSISHKKHQRDTCINISEVISSLDLKIKKLERMKAGNHK